MLGDVSLLASPRGRPAIGGGHYQLDEFAAGAAHAIAHAGKHPLLTPPLPHKQKKLKRVQAAVKRQARKEEGSKHESFAALQLLHDPQVRPVVCLGLLYRPCAAAALLPAAAAQPEVAPCTLLSAPVLSRSLIGPLCLPPLPAQGFAEKLFKRLQGGHERFETRLAMLNVVSRAVGVHKLLLLNFYPFLQASWGAGEGRWLGG